MTQEWDEMQLRRDRDRRQARSRRKQIRSRVRVKLAERRDMGNRLAVLREHGLGVAPNGR